MWQHIWVFAGEACCGRIIDFERPNTQNKRQLSTRLSKCPIVCRSMLRYLRGRARNGEGSCSRENTLPLLCHTHVRRSSNNSQPRDFAAIDLTLDRRDEILTLQAKKTRGGWVDGAAFRAEQKRTTVGTVGFLGEGN